MRKRCFQVFLCVFVCLQAETVQSDFYERLLATPTVTEVTPCFSERFSTYEGWRDSIASKRDDFDRASFEETYDREEFERYQSNTDCAFFIYNVDGLEIGGYALAPKQGSNLPVVVVNRGGTGTFGSMDFPSLFHRIFLFAEHDHFVIGSQYRGGLGKPVEIGGEDEWGGADVEDVLALVPILEHLDEADASRVGMYGASRGSVNMFQAVREFPNVKTVVSLSGVYDLEHELNARPRMNEVLRRHVPDFEENREVQLSKRSVVDWVELINPNVPIFLLHGAYDERATASGALAFAQLLQERFHPYKLTIYERDDHFLSANSDSVDKAILEWFKSYLR